MIINMCRRSQVISANSLLLLKPGLSKNEINPCDGQILDCVLTGIYAEMIVFNSPLVITCNFLLVSYSCPVLDLIRLL